MFQTYAIIGTFLSVAAIIYAYYFFSYLKGNKDHFSITALSDTILTFFIGLFYVYSAIILSQPGPFNGDNGMQNFTNNIDDILTINYNNQTELNIYPEDVLPPKTTTENVRRTEMVYSTTATEEIITESITESDYYAIPDDTQEEVTTKTAEIVTVNEATKKDQFLANYQNFIKQFLKQKFKNSSGIINKDGILNFNGFPLRQKREIKTNTNSEENCFNKNFYEDALLISSFIHCLINLLNQTLYCKKCSNNIENGDNISNEENSVEKENEDKSDDLGSANETQTSVLNDNSSEDKESAAPVGPLFSDKSKTELDTTYSPNIEIFQAKCSSKINLFKNESPNKDILTETKYTSIIEIFISWILPILATLILYFLMNQQMKYDPNDISPINIPNFNSTRITPNIMHVMQHPNSSILDKIISNVYHVVDQVKKNNTNKVTPSTLELLQFMSHQNRVPKQKKSEICPKVTTLAIKLYYFFVYLGILLGIVFYGKIVQTVAKTKNTEYSNQLNNSLISFSVMWLPSIAEVLIRTFFNGNKVGILSDIFLLLGNSNQLYTMASNYYQCKKNNKCNIVEPEP